HPALPSLPTRRSPDLMHGMEFQPRYNAFEGNDFFADGRNMRTPPAGTVAMGLLKEDDAYNRGGDSLNPVARIPVAVTTALMESGDRKSTRLNSSHGKL